MERSRVDPNMLVVTYSCEHNHPWPAARNNHSHRNTISLNTVTAAVTPTTRSSSKATTTTTTSKPPAAAVSDSDDGREASDFSAQPEAESDEKFTNLADSSSVIYSDEFGWFSSFEPTTSTAAVIESTSILTEARVTHADMSVIFSMREEEEESLFAGLGELPECSREFGIGMMERDEARRRHNLTPWCGTA